jgi:hypothetical protein
LEACVGVRPALRPRVHPRACRAGRPHLRRRAKSATERRARFHLGWRMRGKTLKREYLSERAGRRLGDARFGGARCLGLTGDPAGSLSRKGFTLTRFSRAYRERFVCIRIHKLCLRVEFGRGVERGLERRRAGVLPFRVRCDRGIVGDPLVAAAANPGTEREVGACGGDRAGSGRPSPRLVSPPPIIILARRCRLGPGARGPWAPPRSDPSRS